MYKLRPYQEEATDSVIKDLRNPQYTNVALVLATGGGKTVVTGETIARVLKGLSSVRNLAIVFVVHREELVDQTIEKLQAFQIPVSRWTVDKKDLSGKVIVTMVQSAKGLPDALDRNSRKAVLEIVDEGHHYAANSYQNLSRALKCKTLLVTATPIRADNMDLDIDKISYQKTFTELVQEGYLAVPKYYLIRIGGGTPLRSSGADYKKEDLKKLDNEHRNTVIAQDYCDNRETYGKTLCFCIDVAHAYSLRSAYTKLMPDLKTAVVTGQTKKTERKAIVESFHAGDIDVLFNVDVFTEGSDIPSIQTVQIARPTKSIVRWIQAVGRGARIDPETNKTEFIIADYADEGNNYAWLADGFATEHLGVAPDEQLEMLRAEQDFVSQANEWLQEMGSSKKIRTQKELISIEGILMMRTKSGKEKRLIVKKGKRKHLDRFLQYFKASPPPTGVSIPSLVDNYMAIHDKSLNFWPGKYVMYSLAWCLYTYFVVKKREGKPLAYYKSIPDFNTANDNEDENR